MGLFISKIKNKNKCLMKHKTIDYYIRYDNIDYCIKCDIINLNTFLNYHCKLCDSCHYKNKLYCIKCNKCYDPLIDTDLLIHRKMCILE